MLTSTTSRIAERASELVEAGVEAFGVPADLTDSSQANMVVESAAQRFGQLDIVVNNAGHDERRRSHGGPCRCGRDVR